MQTTLKELKHVLSILDDRKFRLMVAALGLEEPVSLEQQTQAYIYEWLTHLGFLSDAQVLDTLRLLGGDWRRLSSCGDVFSISEQRYLTCPLWVTALHPRSYYDLETRERVAVDGLFLVTHIACDVAKLVEHKQQWLQANAPAHESSTAGKP